MTSLAWGAKVSSQFRDRVRSICLDLGIDPNFLMACMYFESGLDPARHNAAGSGAVGLIQFMPQTAGMLGTSTEALARLTAEQQLEYVAKYFRPWTNKLRSLSDVYMVILWPAAVGRAESAVLFDQSDPKHPKLYLQNKGLDFNHDGQITKMEAAAKVQNALTRGLMGENSAV